MCQTVSTTRFGINETCENMQIDFKKNGDNGKHRATFLQSSKNYKKDFAEASSKFTTQKK
jgi:hypothetical protein